MTEVGAPLSHAAGSADARAVIDWWIGVPPYDADWLQARQALWFGAAAQADAHIREHFGPSIAAAADGQLDGWGARPVDWLALLVLLDQFPRNLYRNDARAFANDAKARAAAEAGITQGFDQQLPATVRLFCYLPLEHAEDPAAQRQSVALFERLESDAPAALQPLFATLTDYAHRHAEPIARFGRFPHRNAVLGRTSTPQELEWLERHPQGF